MLINGIPPTVSCEEWITSGSNAAPYSGDSAGNITFTLTRNGADVAYTGAIAKDGANVWTLALSDADLGSGGIFILNATSSVANTFFVPGKEKWILPAPSPVQGETTIPAGQIQWQRSTSISQSIINLGSLSTVTKLYFTAKPVGQNVADSAAAIQMEMTAGVITIAGRTYATPTDGSITVNDSTLGAITIALEPAASALLPLGTFAYDIKTITSGGVVADLTQGTLIVTATPTGAYR